MTKSPHKQSLLDQTEKARKFVQEWVSSNVYNIPGLDDLPREVERLACQITADARMAGISGREIASATGDLDEFLTVEYASRPAPAL